MACTRRTPGCSPPAAAAKRSAHLSERPHHLTSSADPVAEFLAAHEAGEPVALGTSGTAGTRRSVVRTTDSWVSSFATVAELTGLSSSSRVWVPGPLSATMNLFAAVHAGHLSAPLSQRPAGATHAHLTPSALATALHDRTPLDGLTLVVAGDRLPRSLQVRAVDAGARVHHYYGATELSFVAWGSHAEDLRPFPGVEVSVRDGEIWVRSPYLCSGYDGPPGPMRLAADGSATVGDRGHLEGGTLVVAGRPDAVLVGGSVVEPAEVEAVLLRGAAGDVVVLGLLHHTLGRVLAVVLTSREDHPSLLRLARARLDGPHRPRLWFHLDMLPRTPGGKVDREALVAQLAGDDGAARRLV